jgi:NDP-sugar pyrophosphorylase family protein
MLPVAVLAGGLGTRVRHRTGQAAPKALLEVAGVPFIDVKLKELRNAGVARVVMLVGHGAEALVDHVGDGSAHQLDVEFVHDSPRLLGTGGALRHALPRLGPAFFVTYGDTLLEVPMDRLERRLLSTGAEAVMTVLENRDKWETSNVSVANGRVTRYDKVAAPGRHRFLDYGMLAMRATAFEGTPATDPFDLTTVIEPLVQRGTLLALKVTRRFYDIGNEQSIRATETYLRMLEMP